MGRRKARDNAFKCIYELEYHEKNNIDNILDYCFKENNNTDEEKEFIIKTVTGVITNIQDIDSKILSNLKDWTIERIAKIDLAILRLAIFEIIYCNEIPDKVSVNEAVELAKEYGNNESKKFINGLLANIIKAKGEEN